MKKLIISKIALLFIAINCNAQTSKNENNMVERLDIERLERDAEKTVYADGGIFYYLEYKEEDGTMVTIKGDKRDKGYGFTEKRIPKNNPYYWNYKEYYPTGIIKKTGNCFGDAAIELWHSFDEQGNLIKTEDEDKKFGEFKHKDILNFLIENNYVEKDTYKSIFDIYIFFSIEDLTWHIRATSSTYKINDYILDGNTGEVKEHKVRQGGIM